MSWPGLSHRWSFRIGWIDVLSAFGGAGVAGMLWLGFLSESGRFKTGLTVVPIVLIGAVFAVFFARATALLLRPSGVPIMHTVRAAGFQGRIDLAIFAFGVLGDQDGRTTPFTGILVLEPFGVHVVAQDGPVVELPPGSFTVFRPGSSVRSVVTDVAVSFLLENAHQSTIPYDIIEARSGNARSTFRLAERIDDQLLLARGIPIITDDSDCRAAIERIS